MILMLLSMLLMLISIGFAIKGEITSCPGWLV